MTVLYQYDDSNELIIFYLQMITQQLGPEPLNVKQVKLEDFYMTDVISRASPTMAKCVQAANKETFSPHF